MATITSYLMVVLIFIVFTMALLLVTLFMLVPFSNHMVKKMKLPKHYTIEMEENKILVRGMYATAVIAVLLIIVLIAFVHF